MIAQKRPFGLVVGDNRVLLYRAKLLAISYRLRDLLGAHADKDGQVEATQAEIAEELECSVSQLTQGFNELYDVGFVRKIQNGLYQINPEFERYKGEPWKGKTYARRKRSGT